MAKPAARRAARAHPRAGAAVCDVWRGLPLADACADVVLDVFAPRNGAEFRRVLRPGGRLVVVTPTPAHLAELVPLLGLIGVDPDKDAAARGVASGRGSGARSAHAVERELPPRRGRGGRPRGHGPERLAHRPRPRSSRRLAGRAGPVAVTASVTVRTYVAV